MSHSKAPYDYKSLQNKWSNLWLNSDIYAAEDFSKKQKMYVLVEFPYPSGEGLHMGHCRNYTMMDVYSRFFRMSGYNVLYPMGWDAFGLPTYNYAMKVKRDPHEVSAENIQNFKRQTQDLGISFDWNREIDTTDPEYYKWTQWIFVQLYNHFYDKDFTRKDGGKGQARPISDLPVPADIKAAGEQAVQEYQDKFRLAYKEKMPVFWCPFCKMGIANEEVTPQNTHERCDTPVETRDLDQWILRITAYADRLIDDLALVDYSESVKAAQRNWIGRSYGINIEYKIADSDKTLTCFTTTPVNFGATFIVVAPEHRILDEIVTEENKQAVKTYQQETKRKSAIERGAEKEKTGVFTGAYAINHLTGEKLPIWVADFVLASVGTGAVQGCPAHDERDFAFAKKFGLPIIRVVKSEDGNTEKFMDPSKEEVEFAKTNSGTNREMVNSDFLNGILFDEAMQKTMDYFEEKGWGKRTVSYKMRDWVFSRQHYWGEPTPMVHCKECGWQPVNVFDLPVTLPKLESYAMGEDGSSPLEKAEEWKKTTCPKCGGDGTRETDVMPNWAGSNWYYLRYLDPHNKEKLVDFNKAKEWMPVDIYDGGQEHVTLHLLYSRFIYKFLYDLGTAPTPEPYAKRRIHGIVLDSQGKKMSKSKGNVVNPDDVVKTYGTDIVRVGVMFMGPYEGNIAWSDETLQGIRRFLNRVYDVFGEKIDEMVKSASKNDKNGVEKVENASKTGQNGEVDVNAGIAFLAKKVGSDISQLKFNTAIAAMMEFLNKYENVSFTKVQIESFLKILAPFAPFITEELWSVLGNTESIHIQPWPEVDESLLQRSTIEIPVQVNGKVRGSISVTAEASEEEVVEAAKQSNNVGKFVESGIKKVVYVKGKILNIIV